MDLTKWHADHVEMRYQVSDLIREWADVRKDINELTKYIGQLRHDLQEIVDRVERDYE